jgi:hypothetical protein
VQIMNRNTLLAAALAGGALMGLSSVAQAVPAVVATNPQYVYTQPVPQPYPQQQVFVQPAPPAPLYEAIPAPRQGWVWAPGHFEWRNNQYVWSSGRWLEARPGWMWQEAHWRQRSDGSWQLIGGQWVQNDRSYGQRRGGPDGDRDGDGIRNRDDWDRDGDGVADRYDDFPNNPNRS